jgi:hypothetical protein
MNAWSLDRIRTREWTGEVDIFYISIDKDANDNPKYLPCPGAS